MQIFLASFSNFSQTYPFSIIFTQWDSFSTLRHLDRCCTQQQGFPNDVAIYVIVLKQGFSLKQQ